MKKTKLLLLLFVFSLNSIAQNSPDLEVVGGIKVNGNSTLELGKGLAKETNAGKIGYATFTPQTLDIIGAGTTGNTRKIKFWNEGGATFQGGVGVGVANPSEMLDVNGLVYTREGIKFPDESIQYTAATATTVPSGSFPNQNAFPKKQPFALITTSSPQINDTLEIVELIPGTLIRGNVSVTTEPFVVRINFESASQELLRKFSQSDVLTKFAIYLPEGVGNTYKIIELKSVIIRKMAFASNFIGSDSYANLIDLTLDFAQFQIRSTANMNTCFCWNLSSNTTCPCN